MTWLIILLAVVAVVAVGMVVVERRRSAALRERFGPEYERVLDHHGDRRAAESDLRARLKRRRSVDVRELPAESRDRYTARWRVVQAAFVDDPPGSVREAAALVEQVMDERGYLAHEADASPADHDGDGAVDRYELVAIDHPALVERIRAAQSVDGGHDPRATASIDDRREAFLGHRELFDALVHADADAEPVRS